MQLHGKARVGQLAVSAEFQRNFHVLAAAHGVRNRAGSVADFDAGDAQFAGAFAVGALGEIGGEASAAGGVEVDRVALRAVEGDAAVFHHDAARAERFDRGGIVTHEKHGAPRARNLADFAQAFLLKGRVADGEHLIDQQNLRLQMRGHREGKPHAHPDGITLHGCVDEFLDAGKRHDFIELPRDLGARHAEDRAVQEDVVASREIHVKTRPDFQQRRDAPAHFHLSATRRSDARDNFEQRGFPRAIPPEEAEHFAVPHVK